MKIENVKVYGFDESIIASKYPMAVNIDELEYAVTDITRKLGSCTVGGGHDNFLNGIVVQFDLTCSLKMWPQIQRYHFVDFVSSQSTMHRITKFDPGKQCNKYVHKEIIGILKLLIDVYNKYPTHENYLNILYNIPTGFELTARMTTNYRQLKTIYYQRKNHRLDEWKEFCRWIESLPCFRGLCLGGESGEV